MGRMYELFVGMRYIRSRGRNRFVSFISLVSMLGIALGVAVLIVVLSVMNGFEKELRERILSMTSHATMTSIEGRIENWRVAEAAVRNHEQVLDSAPFIQGQGMLLSGDEHTGVAIRGILPDREMRLSRISDHMVEGSLEEIGSRGYSIVLGVDLAEALSVGIGDKVVLIIAQGTVTPAGIVPRMRRFTVTGLFKVGMYEFDRNLGLVNMEDAAKLYRLGDAVSGIRLQLYDMFQAPQVVREIALDLGGGFYIDNWTRQHANFFKSIQLTKRIMFMVLLLVVAVAAFNIVSTLVMVVKDKQADIAILRTIGARPDGIMKIFMVQGTIIGVVGTLAGLLLGLVLATNIEALVRAMENLFSVDFLDASVYFISDLPAQVQWDDVTTICATAFLLSLLSTIYPSWRASRTQPAEALRYE